MNCKTLDFAYDFIELENDNGVNERLFVTALYEVEGRKYLSLVSDIEKMQGSDLDELEGFLYEYMEMGEEFELMEIQDDEEFNRIAALIQAYEDEKNA